MVAGVLRRKNAVVKMKKNATAYLMEALGKLPDMKKKAFIRDALKTLTELQASAPSRRPKLPVEEHKALARVARQAVSLIDALNKAQETETATLLLRDAWLKLDDEYGEKIANPMPTLRRLQEAVESCLPEKNSAQKIVGKSPASTMAVITMADQYRRHFGMAPAPGGASPFSRFVREALPAHGLIVPPLSEIRRLVGT